MTTNTNHDNQPHTDELDRVRIFDTTLRDGEQSPGAAMTHEEKLEVAALLDEMGVDIIEAGFPDRLERRFRGGQRDRQAGEDRPWSAACRARASRTSTAPAKRSNRAKRRRIHTFISTSPVHMKHKLQMEPSAVLEAVAASVARARNWTDDVQWSAEDATRTEHDFLCRDGGSSRSRRAPPRSIFPIRSAMRRRRNISS